MDWRSVLTDHVRTIWRDNNGNPVVAAGIAAADEADAWAAEAIKKDERIMAQAEEQFCGCRKYKDGSFWVCPKCADRKDGLWKNMKDQLAHKDATIGFLCETLVDLRAKVLDECPSLLNEGDEKLSSKIESALVAAGRSM